MTDDDELEPAAVLCYWTVADGEGGERVVREPWLPEQADLAFDDVELEKKELLMAVSDLQEYLRSKVPEPCDEDICRQRDIGARDALQSLINELDELQGDAQ